MRVIPAATLALLISLQLNTITGNNVPGDLVTGKTDISLTSTINHHIAPRVQTIGDRYSLSGLYGMFSPLDMTYDHRL